MTAWSAPKKLITQWIKREFRFDLNGMSMEYQRRRESIHGAVLREVNRP